MPLSNCKTKKGALSVMKKVIQHGLIRFPTRKSTIFFDTGEGNTSVYAIWLRNMKALSQDDIIIEITDASLVLNSWVQNKLDSMVRYELDRARNKPLPSCYIPMLRGGSKSRFSIQWFIDWTNEYNNQVPEMIIRGIEASRTSNDGMGSIQVSGILYLGSCRGVWRDENRKSYWLANRKSLSKQGLILVKNLDILYGSKAKLITITGY